MRYSRQTGLLGIDGQRKLGDSCVTVVGCGGLGTFVSLFLASAGIGKIRLVDGDVPSESNFNRQFFYPGEEGFKADILAEKLKKVNETVMIESVCEFLNEENGNEIVKGSDVMADCLDSIDSRLVLNRFAVSRNIPLSHGGIDGLFGQVTFVIPGKTPCLECIFGNVEEDNGIPQSLSSSVSMIASMQAMDIIKHITGIGETSAGNLLTVSMDSFSWDRVEIRKNPECPVCGEI
jgi:molybdopterin/thiamine biosynthesis adenylyltransferase